MGVRGAQRVGEGFAVGGELRRSVTRGVLLFCCGAYVRLWWAEGNFDDKHGWSSLLGLGVAPYGEPQCVGAATRGVKRVLCRIVFHETHHTQKRQNQGCEQLLVLNDKNSFHKS